jgi:rare lipoprotein A
MPLPLRSASRKALGLGLALVLAACASQPKPRVAAQPPAAKPAVPGVKIGKPYQVFGVTYFPEDDRGYDRTGIASWYGPTFHEKATANGEIYNQDDVTAAHKTLPMPSWVEVTNLDNGRTLVVRINDRGPFVDGRIIDLSRRSAQLLGVDRPGLARVRVKRVFPEGDWARDRPAQPILVTAPAPAPAPLPAPPILASAAIPPVSVAAVPAAGGRFIQVAALSDEGRARALASVLGDYGPAAATPTGTGLWRVRIGPLAGERADSLLDDVRAAGWPDARVVTGSAQ